MTYQNLMRAGNCSRNFVAEGPDALPTPVWYALDREPISDSPK